MDYFTNCCYPVTKQCLNFQLHTLLTELNKFTAVTKQQLEHHLCAGKPLAELVKRVPKKKAEAYKFLSTFYERLISREQVATVLDRWISFTTFDHLIKLYEKPESYSLSADNIVDLMYHLSELNTKLKHLSDEPYTTAIDQKTSCEKLKKRNNKKLFLLLLGV